MGRVHEDFGKILFVFRDPYYNKIISNNNIIRSGASYALLLYHLIVRSRPNFASQYYLNDLLPCQRALLIIVSQREPNGRLTPLHHTTVECWFFMNMFS